MTSAVNSPDLHGPQPHSLSRKLTLAQTTPPPILHVSCEMQLTSQLPDQVLGGNTGALVVGDVHVDSGHVEAQRALGVSRDCMNHDSRCTNRRGLNKTLSRMAEPRACT